MTVVDEVLAGEGTLHRNKLCDDPLVFKVHYEFPTSTGRFASRAHRGLAETQTPLLYCDFKADHEVDSGGYWLKRGDTDKE